jgi:hypothetical protein
VTAITSGAGREPRGSASGIACGLHPEAADEARYHPRRRRVAAATAPATVFGMSWNLRSITRNRRAPPALDKRRVVAREEAAADLESADGAAQFVGERARRSSTSSATIKPSPIQLVHRRLVLVPTIGDPSMRCRVM